MRVQTRINLPEEARTAIDAMRMRWNPEVATGNPAHITILYHDEAPDVGLLRVRLEEACRTMEPFSLRLGSVQRFPEPGVGAFLSVADPAGGIERLRSCVLGPPFSRRTRFGLHLTVYDCRRHDKDPT